jgi:hypothetical protein
VANQSMAVAVVMERRVLKNRWQSFQWEAQGILPDVLNTGTRVLLDNDERLQILFPGFKLALYPSDAEDYYLNISTRTPKVFVIWRMQNELATPFIVTVSYGEAARMMDSNEQVDAVAMPPEIAVWVADFVNQHYKPEPRKKIRRRDPLHQD